ncbi:unnamed protein product [Cochlearia groenlandica]
MGCSNVQENSGSLLNLTGTPFYVGSDNTLLGFGCDTIVALTNVEPIMVGCTSSCNEVNHTYSRDYFEKINCNRNTLTMESGIQICDQVDQNSCNGTRCCKASMSDGIEQIVGVQIDDNTTTKGCKVSFLSFSTSGLSNMYSSYNTQQIHDLEYSTVKLAWSIYTTNLSFVNSLGCDNLTTHYNRTHKSKSFGPRKSCICDSNDDLSYASCACSTGYEGNPYVQCKDIDECVNNLDYCDKGRTCINLQGNYDCYFTNQYKIIGNDFANPFFKRNGGLLLQQQLVSSSKGNIDKTRVFGSSELEKATENFSKNRILGQGGQGTVYKGMLADGRIVAIKKSKVVDEEKLEEFINEVGILSQINHRNIVKLLGCCLETKVPVLVYEFIPNGNLFELIHDDFDDDMMITWDMRLRIAIDIASALSYLHSSASSPIYHRDVKSTNIMLDEKYRAKVADFGTSRSVTIDHTHLTTIVSGTMGYIDPEYFQSSQFTDKSDVYSFGVVLAELITGQKSISVLRSQENRPLANYLILAMKENKLFDIIDPRIRDVCKLDQVTLAAKIAKRCLNLKGKKRPNMVEVSMELERIRSSIGDIRKHEYVSEDDEDIEDIEVTELNIGVESWNNSIVTAPASQYNIGLSSFSCSEVEPLFPLKTR